MKIKTCFLAHRSRSLLKAKEELNIGKEQELIQLELNSCINVMLFLNRHVLFIMSTIPAHIV